MNWHFTKEKTEKVNGLRRDSQVIGNQKNEK